MLDTTPLALRAERTENTQTSTIIYYTYVLIYCGWFKNPISSMFFTNVCDLMVIPCNKINQSIKAVP